MFPIWLKIGYAAFLLVLIPIYYKKYGPANFLWFSDIALFGAGVALWLEDALLASTIAVFALIPEVAWNVDYFFRLLSGKKLTGLSSYMFDSKLPRYLRALSLFHVPLPPIILYLLFELGYEESALLYAPALAAAILLLCYFFTDPEENINRVFGPGEKPQDKLPSSVYLLLLMMVYFVAIYLPTHFLLIVFFRN